MLESIFNYLKKHLPVLTVVYETVVDVHRIVKEILKVVKNMTATTEQVLAAINEWKAGQDQLISDVQALLAAVTATPDLQPLLDAVNAGIATAQSADATVQAKLNPPAPEPAPGA